MSAPASAPTTEPPPSAMPTMAVIFGIILISLGLFAFLFPDMLGGGKKLPQVVLVDDKGVRWVAEGEVAREPAAAQSPTSLIPAGIGAVILLAGIASIVAPDSRKHAMHAAALAALLGSLGGLYPVYMHNNDTGQASVVSGYLMTVASMFFLSLCINSFVTARRDREATPVPTA